MTPTVTDADLIALALGQVAPARRERVEAWLRADAMRRERYDAIRRHLARYDVLAAAEEGPALSSAGLLASLPPQRSGRAFGRRPWAPATALLTTALLLVALVPFFDTTTEGGLRAGEGVLVLGRGGVSAPASGRLEPGTRITCREIAEVELGKRGRLVLDTGAVLTMTRADDVRLEEGRAYFDLAPGPFVVRTPRGDVEVLGTSFEVGLSADRLIVAVERGRVRVGKHVLPAGSRLVDDVREDGVARPGAFFRRARLDVLVPGPVGAGQSTPITLVLTNPTPVAFSVGEPEDVRAAVWLAIRGPGDEVRDRALAGIVERWGLTGADRGLPAGASRRADIVLENAFPEPGVYRCQVMYRPRGEAPVVSTELLLEVVE